MLTAGWFVDNVTLTTASRTGLDILATRCKGKLKYLVAEPAPVCCAIAETSTRREATVARPDGTAWNRIANWAFPSSVIQFKICQSWLCNFYAISTYFTVEFYRSIRRRGNNQWVVSKKHPNIAVWRIRHCNLEDSFHGFDHLMIFQVLRTGMCIKFQIKIQFGFLWNY